MERVSRWTGILPRSPLQNAAPASTSAKNGAASIPSFTSLKFFIGILKSALLQSIELIRTQACLPDDNVMQCADWDIFSTVHRYCNDFRPVHILVVVSLATP